MAERDWLRRYNGFAVAVLLTLGIIFAAFVVFVSAQSYFAERRLATVGAELSDAKEPAGQELSSRRGPIVLYDEPGEAADARQNLRFVEMKTGRSAAFADDPETQVYAGTILSRYADDRAPSSGYIGLVKTGTKQDKPIFEARLIRFSDMKRFVVAHDIAALDAPTMVGTNQVGVVVWDQQNRGQWLLFDIDKGETVDRSDIDARSMPSHAKAAEGAPKARFY
ncbi:hypothetical protein B2G71_07070 [Novosphingobium sp. PC22D]|uniref:hypothetical protein n=1 Tax=Novosphingobium sp. PC22D TaxID=1962403 RepID=UPI000BF17311|nr:hypothetical protein [Novosphingobium sp. PC22D]PEQ13197.1 hypothetical protein B2G71_07070 [Novosphingobium sp. PC22D]